MSTKVPIVGDKVTLRPGFGSQYPTWAQDYKDKVATVKSVKECTGSSFAGMPTLYELQIQFTGEKFAYLVPHDGVVVQ